MHAGLELYLIKYSISSFIPLYDGYSEGFIYISYYLLCLVPPFPCLPSSVYLVEYTTILACNINTGHPTHFPHFPPSTFLSLISPCGGSSMGSVYSIKQNDCSGQIPHPVCPWHKILPTNYHFPEAVYNTLQSLFSFP